jgi:hypothetical protein
MSLSSLIVQREVATMRQVEEALARQVIYGGDLVTNLLEVARVDEAVLTGLLAESMRMTAAPSGELPVAGERVRSLLPPEMATQRAVVPLALEGERLVLAVAEPMPGEMEEELAFALGMTIEQRAAPAVRVKQLISRIYGVPLERRMQRLIARLSGEASGSGSTPPPLGLAPAIVEPPRPPSAPPARHSTSRSFPAAKVAAAELTSEPPPLSDPDSHFEAPMLSEPPPLVTGSVDVTDHPDSEPPSTPVVPERRTGLLQREVPQSVRAARRRRGPVTMATGKAEAEEATDRDALLDLYFDFARQFFDYTALFLVHGDIAEGRDAFGLGASRERVVGIGVPLDLPGLMSGARDKRVPVVTKPPSDGLEAELLADLGRPRNAEIALIPLVVRTRAVALLLGDNGEHGVDRGSLQQVVAFAGVIGKAFERIIVRRKLDGFIAGNAGGTAGRIKPASVPPKRTSLVPSLGAPPPPTANIASVRPIVGPPIPREDPPDSSPKPGRAPSVPPPRSQQPLTPAPVAVRSPAPPVAVRSSASPVVARTPSAPPVSAGSELGGSVPPTRPATPTAHAHAQALAQAQVAGVPPGLPLITADGPEAEVQARELFDELGWDSTQDDDAPPPPSAAIAVPPHKPPLRHTDRPSEPSVVVNIEDELAAIVDRLAAGEADEQAEGELLRQGERAMRVLMDRFPGPVVFERAKIAVTAPPPRASECGPVLRLVARERKVALPFVLEKLVSQDTEIRGWATHVLGELPYAEAIAPLLLRLRDIDLSIRVSAAYALVSVARIYPEEVRGGILGLARSSDPIDRSAAMRVMGELREPSLVPELVHALADGDEAAVASAHAALYAVTRQDFGLDARPWLRWWEANAQRHRIEWLIDALTHDIGEIRRSAGEELRAITKEYFGYAADLPPRDRERAQQRYRDWWITEGRARFRRNA